jgi:hypothetical protein
VLWNVLLIGCESDAGALDAAKPALRREVILYGYESALTENDMLEVFE